MGFCRRRKQTIDAPPFADYANSPHISADPFVGANVDPELEYAMQPVAAVAETQCISPQAIQNAESPAYPHYSHHTAEATQRRRHFLGLIRNL